METHNHLVSTSPHLLQSGPRGVRQSTIVAGAVVLTLVMSALLAFGIISARNSFEHLTETIERSDESRELARQVQKASAFLTNQARKFSVGGDRAEAKKYWDEIEITDNRGKAVKRLAELGVSKRVFELLEEASANSNDLVNTENRSMRLRFESMDVAPALMPKAVRKYELSEEDAALDPLSKARLSQEIMFDETYEQNRRKIMTPLQAMLKLIDEDATKSTKAAEKELNNSFAMIGAVAVLVCVSIIAFFGLFNLLVFRVVGQYSHSLERRDPADLRFRLVPQGIRELQLLALSFNQSTAKMNDEVRKVSQRAHQVAEVASRIGEVSHQVSCQAQNSLSGVSRSSASGQDVRDHVASVAAATEEFRASIQEIARSSADAASVAQSAVETSHSVRDSFDGLTRSSVAIGEVLQLIASIADQTNLLALNATIEAARAGESGKGFAVVASEVKDLAQQTATATKEISDSIQTIQQQVQEASDGMTQVNRVIERINDHQTSIASAVEEQAAVTAEIAQSAEQASHSSTNIAESISDVEASVHNISERALESSQAGEQMDRIASELSGLVGLFKTTPGTNESPDASTDFGIDFPEAA